ncbi:putative chromatin regulator PHD family [Arabidopsis thaliana]
MSLTAQIYSYLESTDSDELSSLFDQLESLVESMYSEPPEMKLISLIRKVMPLTNDTQLLEIFQREPLTDDAKLLISRKSFAERDAKVISLIFEIITLVNSTDLDSLPESELMSVVTQTISVFNSMDLDSQPEPLRLLISLLSQKYSDSSELELDLDSDFTSLVNKTLRLEPEPKLISLILEIVTLVFSMYTKWENLISLCPRLDVSLKDGKFHVGNIYMWNGKLECLPSNWVKFRFTGGELASHFLCQGCNGENHKGYIKAPVEIKHPFHPKHSLLLVSLKLFSSRRKCYCCEKSLKKIFYYCSACDFAVNFACVQKPPDLSMHHPKWHEHTLALFPTQTPFPCSVCALTHSSCPFYTCPPCDFVIHQKCFSLPRVIRISRHPHRISICRRKIDNDYGCYSCVKDGCSYAAHSKCATQTNVWDGKELEGEPEEDMDEEVEPFVTISEGIIQHFSHEHHHMKLDVNTDRDYDENNLCQPCTTPIYFGNFFSCMQCDFILHEECASFRRKIYHPIHPHLLTLSRAHKSDHQEFFCSACSSSCTIGFFYECNEENCYFKVHVECATISEPLVHESHVHPLFLTSKPEETRRTCYVCKGLRRGGSDTFNCIEECDFALCFGCATIPNMVRYKHDKHMLTLSYGEKTSTMTYWCEVCEGKIDPKKRFYMCDEYCCVTLHMSFMLGRDLNMKPGSSLIRGDKKIYVLPNNHMSRPICLHCKKRCPFKAFFIENELAFCSIFCVMSKN